jgi:hypothetical protein
MHVRLSPHIRMQGGIYGHVLLHTAQPRALVIAKAMNGLMEARGPLLQTQVARWYF